EKILFADTAKGVYLINADNIFLTESLQQVKPVLNPKIKGDHFTLGSLNKEKTIYTKMGSYPLNTDVTVEYVYDNLAAYIAGGKDVTDKRFVSIQVQHSIIEIPQNNYKPRRDDPRIGFFNMEADD